jgi:hypothetical protein
MACFCTLAAGIGADLAVVMLVHAAFLGAHTANFFAKQQVLMPYFRFSIQQPCRLAA